MAPVRPPPIALADAPIPEIVASARGGRCSPTLPCAESLTCTEWPGGYCASVCDDCDGACVDTTRSGEVCAAKCTTDGDCRADEGYVCDREWRACILPNAAVIVPRVCPAGKLERDASFGTSETWPIVERIVVEPAQTLLAETFGSAVIDSGTLHVIRLFGSIHGAFGSAQQRIEYVASRDRGATFSVPVTVSGNDEVLPFFFSNPSVAVDAKRKWIYAAYVRGTRDAAWDIIVAASKDGGVKWTRKKIAGDGCAIHMVPNVAIDPANGTLHVAYFDNEGGAGRFAHASCTTGLAKCTQHGAISDRPFATLSMSRDPMKSVGDFASLRVDAKLRVLDAAWKQPLDEGGKAIVKIFHAQAKLKK